MGLLYHCWPLPVSPAELSPDARRFVMVRTAFLRAANGVPADEQDTSDG